MVLSGIARSMASSGLNKALSFQVVELALRDDEAVRFVPQARGKQLPLLQRFVERSLVPEMVEQLVAQDGIQRRTAEQIVAFRAPVLPDRISERISEQSEITKVTETSDFEAYSGEDTRGLWG